MRYRPMGATGANVSAISLALRPDRARRRPGDWTPLIYAALENGVNTFEVMGDDEALTDGVAQALSALDRRLVFIAWRLEPGEAGHDEDLSAGWIDERIGAILAHTGLGHLDAAILDAASAAALSASAAAVLHRAKRNGQVRLVGVAGDGDVLDPMIAAGGFDVIATQFSITSDWRDRNRLRAASGRDIALIGLDAYSRDFHAAATKASARKSSKNPLAGCGSYAFLDRTPGWTAEEICIAYALTEPSLATVQVEATSIARLETLAKVPDREMPQGLPAQIEMARFSPGAEAAEKRRA